MMIRMYCPKCGAWYKIGEIDIVLEGMYHDSELKEVLTNLIFNAGASQIYDRRFDNTDQGTRVQGRMDYSGQPLQNIRAKYHYR